MHFPNLMYPMNSVTSLYLSPQGWTSETQRIYQCLKSLGKHKLKYVFLHDDIYSGSKTLAPDLQVYFKIPEVLLSEVYRKSNGFFDSKAERDEDGRLTTFYSWYRVLVKTIDKSDLLKYKWQEMTFFTRWDVDHSTIFCIGTDPEFERLLQETLASMWKELPSDNPWSMQVPLLEAIIAQQDCAVWSVRDVVRVVEKNRLQSTPEHSSFVQLHEAARHTAHSFETLGVSIHTIEALQQEVLEASVDGQRDRIAVRATKQIHKHIATQLRMMRNLLARSQSNRDRLQNEISLAYNMIAQRDSRTMTGLGEAARRDSRAMRTIAIVTMAFLPPTFLSAIFSMSFFSFQPEQGGDDSGWKVSDKFWVYWAFAVPLTCFTLAVWFWRQRFGGKPRMSLGIEV